MPVKIFFRDHEHTGQVVIEDGHHLPISLRRKKLTQQMTVVFGNGQLNECQRPIIGRKRIWSGQNKLLLPSDKETILGTTPEGYTVSAKRLSVKSIKE